MKLSTRACIFGLFAVMALGVTAPVFAQEAQESLIIGCCQMVKTNGASEVKDSNQAECEKPDEENYQSKQWFRDKRRLGSKCETKLEVQNRNEGDPIIFKPAVTIPGSNYVAGTEVPVAESTSALANYIVAIFKYSVGVIGIISVIVMMVGGVLWLTAAGNSEQVGNAKKMIASALTGSVLAACSFLLLSIINTNLVNLKITHIPTSDRINFTPGCCLKQKGAETTADEMLAEECVKSNESLKDFDKLTFYANRVAQDNKCIETKGCCSVEVVNWSFFNIIEGERKQAYCLNNIEKKVCDEQSSGLLNSFPGTSLWAQFLNKPDLNDNINTDFELGKKCQEIVECTAAGGGQTYN